MILSNFLVNDIVKAFGHSLIWMLAKKESDKDEISSLMGNPTDSLMKRIRPGKPPEIRKEETA